jgi:hypothetical protein
VVGIRGSLRLPRRTGAAEQFRATRSAASAAPSAQPRSASRPSAATARAMALSAPEGLKGLRDRALLLRGIAGAFPRSELVAGPTPPAAS